jgi:hypothetical protein
MSHQTTGRIEGVLFLAAFVCCGVGSALAYRPIGPALMLVGLAVGLVLAIPGRLFEVALGVILIVRGIPEPIRTPQTSRMSVANDRLGANA